MIQAVFTNEMKTVISEMKGHNLVSYEGAIDEFSQAYGNLRLNLDNGSIEITNEAKTTPFFDDEEDVSCFACKRTDPGTPFTPAVVSDTTMVPVGETITSIEVINDTIDVNHGEYQISLDVALVIHTNSKTLMFARDVWFSEVITIREDDNYENVISEQNIIDSWSNDGDYSVSIERTRHQI